MQVKSNYLDEKFIEEVKNANNIVDIISNYVDLKKMGDNYKGLCPFHNEKTPSFMVNENKQIFKCFGCGEGGSVISFLMKRENISFTDAIKILCEKARIDFPTNNINAKEFIKHNEKKQRIYDLHIDLARYYFENMQNNLDDSMSYLKKRGIDEKTIRKFGLGYEGNHSNAVEYLLNLGYESQELLDSMIFKKKENRIYSIFFSRIMYPIFDYKNRVVAFGGRITKNTNPKYLNSPESVIFKKKEQLYGLNLVKKYGAKRIILVEGYMDVIRLNQNGIVGAVASLGTSLTKEQSEIIKKQNKKVYICYDSDNAGRLATIRAIEILENSGIKPYIIQLGSYKDPDEFFDHEKSVDFMNKINLAISTLSFIVDDLKRAYNLDIYSQKLEFIDRACEKIKYSNDAVEMEYQCKKLAEITNTSIKAIGTKIYGKYFSPKQFAIDVKDNHQNIEKIQIPRLENEENRLNEERLNEIIKENPNCIIYIKDILDLEDFFDDKIKVLYNDIDEEKKQDMSDDSINNIKKLAIFIKINKLEKKIEEIQKTVNYLEKKDITQEEIKKISLLTNEKIELIKRKDRLKQEIKGLV